MRMWDFCQFMYRGKVYAARIVGRGDGGICKEIRVFLPEELSETPPVFFASYSSDPCEGHWTPLPKQFADQPEGFLEKL